MSSGRRVKISNNCTQKKIQRVKIHSVRKYSTKKFSPLTSTDEIGENFHLAKFLSYTISPFTIVLHKIDSCSCKNAPRKLAKTVGKNSSGESRGLHCVYR